MTIRYSQWPYRLAQNGHAFSHGIVEPEGRTVRMTGQVAWDGLGNLIVEGDCAAQIRQCFDNLAHILGAVGAGSRT